LAPFAVRRFNLGPRGITLFNQQLKLKAKHSIVLCSYRQDSERAVCR
jgi:hypothetical protein